MQFTDGTRETPKPKEVFMTHTTSVHDDAPPINMN